MRFWEVKGEKERRMEKKQWNGMEIASVRGRGELAKSEV